MDKYSVVGQQIWRLRFQILEVQLGKKVKKDDTTWGGGGGGADNSRW